MASKGFHGPQPEPRVESDGMQNLADRVGSGQEVFKISPGSDQAGSGGVKRFSTVTDRVGLSLPVKSDPTRPSKRHSTRENPR